MSDIDDDRKAYIGRLENRIAELESAALPVALRAQITGLRITHYYCDDCWYSCPLAEEGCSDDSVPKGKCNCNAERHNAAVDALLVSANALFATAKYAVQDTDWLIFSRDHNAWWGAERAGYSLLVEDAGRYTKAEALRLTTPSSPRAGSDIPYSEPADIPVPLSAFAALPVATPQFSERCKHCLDTFEAHGQSGYCPNSPNGEDATGWEPWSSGVSPFDGPAGPPVRPPNTGDSAVQDWKPHITALRALGNLPPASLGNVVLASWFTEVADFLAALPVAVPSEDT